MIVAAVLMLLSGGGNEVSRAMSEVARGVRAFESGLRDETETASAERGEA